MIQKALSLLVAIGLIITGFNPAQAQWNANRRIPAQYTRNASRVANTYANPYTKANVNTRQMLYNYAKQGNTNGMRQVLQQYRIDTPDYKGNSLLCESVYNKDYAAFTTLKRMGASMNHSCINQIPDQTVAEFNQEYMEWVQAVNAGKISYGTTAGNATGAVATTSGLSTGAMVGIGVGAAALIGGGIAIASSGGGSSSSSSGGTSSSTETVCSGHGTKESGTCSCTGNYYGTNCENAPLSCGSHGTWNTTTHVCDCSDNYYGTTCGTAPLTCVHGTWNTSTHKCDCTGDYTGATCSTLGGETDLCDGITCSGHGTCSAGTCSCTGNYYGTNCENAPLDCGSNGSWNTTNHECDCLNNYYGTTCGTAPLTCVHGTWNTTSHVCNCSDNYYGDTCGTAPLSCGEHGSWNTTNHECDCSGGYSGETCQTAPANACAGVSCGDHGSCSGGTCTCTDDYYGTNCENPPLDCGDNGTWNTDTHECDCSGGYSGTYCQVSPATSDVSGDGYIFNNSVDTHKSKYTVADTETLTLQTSELASQLTETIQTKYANDSKEIARIAMGGDLSNPKEDPTPEDRVNAMKYAIDKDVEWESEFEGRGRSFFSIESDANASVTPTFINNGSLTLQGSDTDTLQNYGVVVGSSNGNIINNGTITASNFGFFDGQVATYPVTVEGITTTASDYMTISSSVVGVGMHDVANKYSLFDWRNSDETDEDYYNYLHPNGNFLFPVTINETRSFSLQNTGTIQGIVNDDFSRYEVDEEWMAERNLSPMGVIDSEVPYDGLVSALALSNPYSYFSHVNEGKTASELEYLQDMITGTNEKGAKILLNKGTGVNVVGGKFTNKGLIKVNEGIGIYTLLSTIINQGTITVEGKLTGSQSVFSGSGIVGGKSTIINTEAGVINVANGYGIVAEDSIIENYGTINVTSGTGIKGYGTTTTIYNAGTINASDELGGSYTIGSAQYHSTTGEKLTLSSATFTALANSKTNSSVPITGSATIDKSLVNYGFQNTYVGEDMFNAPDTSNLKLVSNSAMFDAKLADNGSDVVMTKKAFSSLTSNSSLANFLEQNYALGNNEAFYNELKEIGSTSAFKSGLNSLTGMNVLNRFAYEDLTAIREMNLAMNQQMFANDDKNIFTTQGSLNNFSFKNGEASSGQFALGNRKVSPNLRVGYAMSVTRLNTNDEANDNSRNSTIFQMAMPFNYNTKGLKMISTPMAGFARGHYSRTGFNDSSYDGIIEKRMFGWMNEMRYPFKVGGFELAPTFELNAIAYNQKGGEDDKPYSLTIQSDNNLSVEAGVGMYASKDYQFSKDAKLNLNAGMMLYREFADPYNMKLGMQGMSGSFDLYDEDRSEYRGVASFGLDYKAEDLDIYGAVQHYMEDENHTNVKSGLKWKF